MKTKQEYTMLGYDDIPKDFLKELSEEKTCKEHAWQISELPCDDLEDFSYCPYCGKKLTSLNPKNSGRYVIVEYESPLEKLYCFGIIMKDKSTAKQFMNDSSYITDMLRKAVPSMVDANFDVSVVTIVGTIL